MQPAGLLASRCGRGTGTYWVQTHTPTNPMFTDSSGASTLLLPVMSDYVSVLQYGAVGDGATDCTAAFVAAAAVAGRNVYIPPGRLRRRHRDVYHPASSSRPARPCRCSHRAPCGRSAAGSRRRSSRSSATCRVDAARQAPVVVNQAVNTDGWVDWFGTDAAAIEACHKVFTVTRLQAESYLVRRTVVLDQSYRQVVGAYGDAQGRGGTCIVLIGDLTGTATVVQVGTTSAAIPSLLTRKLEVSWINTARDGPCVLSASRYVAPVGWNVQGPPRELPVSAVRLWVGHQLPNVRVRGGDAGAVQLRQRDAGGRRERRRQLHGLSGRRLVGQLWICGGQRVAAPAQLHVRWRVRRHHWPECQQAAGRVVGVYTLTSGVYLYGYTADTWINQFEASNLSNGLVVDGNDAAGAQVTTQYSQQGRLHRPRRPGRDAAERDARPEPQLGLDGRDLGRLPGDDHRRRQPPGNGLLITACVGAILVTGGVMLSTAPSVLIYGISIQSSSGVTVQGAMLKNYTFAMFCTNSSGIWANALMTRTLTGTESAVYLANVTRSYFAPTVTGSRAHGPTPFSFPATTSRYRDQPQRIQVSSLVVPLSGSSRSPRSTTMARRGAAARRTTATSRRACSDERTQEKTWPSGTA